jgi:hypothetical protein
MRYNPDNNIFITNKIIERFPSKIPASSHKAVIARSQQAVMLDGGLPEKRKFRQYAKKLRLIHNF